MKNQWTDKTKVEMLAFIKKTKKALQWDTIFEDAGISNKPKNINEMELKALNNFIRNTFKPIEINNGPFEDKEHETMYKVAKAISDIFNPDY